jgi:hypothetical protein
MGDLVDGLDDLDRAIRGIHSSCGYSPPTRRSVVPGVAMSPERQRVCMDVRSQKRTKTAREVAEYCLRVMSVAECTSCLSSVP